jgi:hypothetical protein
VKSPNLGRILNQKINLIYHTKRLTSLIRQSGETPTLTKGRKEVNSIARTILLMLLLSSLALAQNELLPDGAYGTTIHGGIKAGESKAYLLRAEVGQVFKAHVSTRNLEKGATLELVDSDGTSVLGEIGRLTKVDTLNLILPKTDEYQLNVKAGSKNCAYVLEVTLDDPKPKTPSEKIDRGPMTPPRPSPVPRRDSSKHQP